MCSQALRQSNNLVSGKNILKSFNKSFRSGRPSLQEKHTAGAHVSTTSGKSSSGRAKKVSPNVRITFSAKRTAKGSHFKSEKNVRAIKKVMTHR
jgi:hypothetical protein